MRRASHSAVAAGPFTVRKGLCSAFVERDGEHFATLNDFDTAKSFAVHANELLRLADFAGAWTDEANPERARWRVGALLAKMFDVPVDHAFPTATAKAARLRESAA